MKSDGPRPIILIIDDTPANLMVLGSALEGELDLRVATSGAEGLRLAAELRPELILLDIMMPEMDGFEVCRRLKAEPLLQGIPVIFVTAMSESEAEADGLALGAADYLTKPVNVDVARQRIRNLVERERLRKQIETQALEAASKLASLKLAFMRNISHELRTPLNGILGLATIGQRAPTLEKAQMGFRRIEDVATEYLALIENLLNFDDARSGNLEVVNSAFDLGLLVDELVFHWSHRASAKGLQAVTENLPQLGDWRYGDARWIIEVLRQLLDNSVKFTDQGQVSLVVSHEREVVIFSVLDSGIGMSKAEVHAAFHPFEQVDGSLTRRFGGVGLALALVNLLVERMGGTLQVKSTPGKGTCFDLRLPLPPAEPVIG